MPEFPASPVSPSEFMEGFLPAALEEAEEFRAALGDLDAVLGVVLVGDSGGEWTVHVHGGQVRVQPGPRDEAAFTLVQSVDDWRGALWEGRGGVLGEQAAEVFRPKGAPTGGLGAVPGPAALAKMRELDGLVRLAVGGDGDGEEWRLDLKLGPGPIPPEPSASLSIGSEDATALARAPEGERAGLLLQYFMAGRIRIDGDVGLFMQMQAIQMQTGSGGNAA